jgi:hypothetical protein
MEDTRELQFELKSAIRLRFKAVSYYDTPLYPPAQSEDCQDKNMREV